MADSDQVESTGDQTIDLGIDSSQEITSEAGYWNLKELMKRYGIKKSVLNKRIEYLELEPNKTDKKRCFLYSQEQVKYMDDLHFYIKKNRKMAGFPVSKLNEPKEHVEETAIVPLTEESQPKTSFIANYQHVTRNWVDFSIIFLMSAIVAVNGVSIVSAIATVAGAIKLFLIPPKKSNSQRYTPKPEAELPVVSKMNTEPTKMCRLYRQGEFNRIVASLLANSSILVVGKEGSGKSFLASAVIEKLRDDGFNVASIEPATSKQMLLNISEQIGIETQTLEGKSLTANDLKLRITTFLQDNVTFLIVDDCQSCESRFRCWLKELKKQKVPILLFATNPPRTDVFFSMPPLILGGLPDYAIREIMEQAALERGLNLKNSDLARLQERAGGNPMLAQRVIDEEYLGLEFEGADHNQYIDITPLILIAGVGFIVLRFIGLGTNNHNLYIASGIGAAVFLGVSRLLYNLPKESKRIN
ncbi:MAG: ATP-binding protein [Rhizonema sp. PD38]|nr:ATP-binding protein [Rhizonema sp. PD38]